MNLAESIFVGFIPKARPARPDGFKPAHVVEICSVSNCINAAPEGWVDLWRHNELGFYDTEDLALACISHQLEVACSSPGNFEVFAYRLFPLVFDNGQQLDFRVPVSPLEPEAGFKFIGHDVVSRSVSPFFECSPLSCNYAAQEFAVNSWCLIENIADAVGACRKISAGNYEPGPYYLFEVLRKGRDV